MRRPSSPRAKTASGQQGAVLIITLIALALIMLSALALIRSFDNSLNMAGNLAFKRDLVNEGERGMTQAIQLFDAGGALAGAAAREADSDASNYFAAMLPANDRGIPNALLAKSANAADIDDAAAGVKIVYLIDRMCQTAGKPSAVTCVGYTPSTAQGGSGHLSASKVGQGFQPVYRISVRANGPRNTQVYLQTTITR